jgi:hypothetical protein
MEVIQLRDWETTTGKAQGNRVMGAFISKMTGKEGALFNKEKVAESVKYSTYSSDTNLDDKLKLAKMYGFQVMESGKERGLDYYDLELVKKPLFGGLGAPGMGADKPKMDFEKDSGWKKGKDKKKDKGKIKDDATSERESDYDYERDRDRERAAKERESRESRGRERDRDRDRYRDEEPDEDVDDWSRDRRGRGRDRDRRDKGYTRYDRDRDRDRRPPKDEYRSDDYHTSTPDRWPIQQEEAPPEKPKKRPPPPKIVAD